MSLGFGNRVATTGSRGATVVRRVRDISILDRVYEHVSLPPIVTAVIDTPEFQRLRGLKQLGASSFLYPGAIHTRFEHSIGVAHLARQFLNVIAEKQPELFVGADSSKPLSYHVECAMLAGLCHDIGHGPFSHLFEDVIATRCAAPTKTTTPLPNDQQSAPFCHEAMSQSLMLRVATRLGLDDGMIGDVSALMSGGKGCGVGAPFYKELISNKRNGIDVDRLDYLIRDSLCCFGKPTMDVRVNRLFNSARIIPAGDGGGDFKIAYEQKMAVTIRDLFSLRAKLHKSVYQHHVVKAVGHMIGDILFHAAGSGQSDSSSGGDDFLRIGGYSLQECAADPELFIKLGDWILDAIDASGPSPSSSSSQPHTATGIGAAACAGIPLGLCEARRLLHKLRTRELYSLSGCINIDSSILASSGLAQPTLSQIKSQLLEALRSTSLGLHPTNIDAIEQSIIVEVVAINHGKGNKDPLQFVDFYNPKDTSNLNRCFSLQGSSPLLSPSVFEEWTIMVFSRERDHNGPISAAFEMWALDGGLNGGVSGALYPGLAFHNPRI